MSRENELDDDLIDLGAVTEETKGLQSMGQPDELTGLAFGPGLDPE
ncbi:MULTISPECIES: benenodin family lasso peptide [Sphingomonadaceae]|nr:benenodin family lasso peptide [Sphingobium sp. TKS]MCF8710027.1 benenodin family lasso peptide [Rhizorhapis sp. SPR117]